MKDLLIAVTIAATILTVTMFGASFLIKDEEQNKIKSAPDISYYLPEDFANAKDIPLLLKNGFKVKTTEKYVIVYRCTVTNLDLK